MNSADRFFSIIAIGVALITALLFSIFATDWFKSDQYVEVTPTRGDLSARILASGRIQPDNRVDIRPPIPGRVEEILVREGDHVKQGQILLWMSSSERAAIIDAARVVGPEEAKHWEKTNPATPVIAPVDGLIIQRNVEPSQSFGTSLPILVLSDRFVVEAPIDETDVSRVTVGQQATTIVDAFPETPFESRVLRVAHESTQVNNVTSYMMEIEILNPPEHLRIGMTATVEFETVSKRDTLLIPSVALQATENQIYVLAAEKSGGRPERRDIQIGLSDKNMTEVVSGLSESDVVFIPNQNAPKP